MKSGLWACAGASATASAAAWAKRFDEPMTNESKVYFGFIPPPGGLSAAARRGGISTLGSDWGSRSATVRAILRSCPVVSRTAAEIRPKKCPSIHSRVNPFGTVITNASSVSSAPAALANHVRYVVVFSAPLSRSATSAHRLSAFSSSWPSTCRCYLFLSRRAEGGEHNSVPERVQPPDFQAFFYVHIALHRCGNDLVTKVLLLVIESPGVWITPWATLVYTEAPLPLGRRVFLPLCIFLEADLPAKRASAEAPSRLSCADGDPRGSRDPEASAGQGPQASLGVGSAGAAQISAQPFPRFRRRLPAGPVGLVTVPRPLLVSPR